MSTLGERIRDRRNELGLSQQDICDLFDPPLKRSSVSKWESNSSSPSYQRLLIVAKKLETSAQYLLSGIQDGTPIEEVRPVAFDDMVEIKYYPEIPGSCGSGRFAEALEENYVLIKIRRSILNRYNVNPADVKAFPSDGNSMRPRIEDKATVYVDMSKKKIIDEKIYAICHGGLFKFKQLYNLPLEGVRIVSTNAEEYPEEKLTKAQRINQEFQVIGYAFWVENGLP